MTSDIYMSSYATQVLERRTHTREAKLLAVFLLSLLSISAVCLLYLNVQNRVALRNEEIRTMASENERLQRRSQDISFQIAQEMAPQRVEERARKLKLQPIEKWEVAKVPGFASKWTEAGPIPTSAPSLAAETVTSAATPQSLSPGLVWAQLLTWFAPSAKASAGSTRVP